MCETLRKRPLDPLTEGELSCLLDVLRGEFKEIALLSLITRRSPRELVNWTCEVVPLLEALLREFQSLNSSSPDSPLFPGLSKLPPKLLGSQACPAESLRAMSSRIFSSLEATATQYGPDRPKGSR